jgi:hypothetical protein
MPGLLEPNQVGKRQDLSDYIVNIERDNYPLIAMLPKDKDPVNTEFETQVDDYGDTDDLDGVPAGKDADKFENQAANRGIIKNKVQKIWENPMVDDFAENVSENPAVTSEYLEAVRKSTVRLKFRMEKRLLSQREAEDNATSKGYGTCAIGGFLKAAAPTGVQTVPARFRTPAAQIYSSTLSALKEEDMQGLLQELFESTNGAGDYVGFVGSELKQTVSFWTLYRTDVASNTIVRRFDAASDELKVTVDVLTGDFGTIKLVPTTRMRWQTADGTANSAALRKGSGYILSLKLWALAMKRRPGHRRLEDAGGGPRGIVDAIFGLRCKNPKGNAAVTISG